MSKGKILIVEDNEDLVHMLEYNLNKRGYQTLTALNGLVACRQIEVGKSDLVLLDIMLPGMDGWEICKIIRSHHHEDISEIPIIMLTALGSSAEKMKGIELGADDYIPKPFSVKEVLLKVDRLIARELKKRSLNTEVKKFEAMETQRTDFQNMLFHELRNQLLIIGGYSNRMAKNRFLTPEEQRLYAGVIREHSRSLNSLTEEVLLFSRLETCDYSLPVDDIYLEETIRQIIDGLSQPAEEKGIRIHFEQTGKMPMMRLNSTAIKYAISNLIENAIKYGPERSTIIVRSGLERERKVVVEVEDHGPGIPKEERAKVFDRFYRGKDMKNQTKGTGLGLYISKMLIESMGGSIGLQHSGPNGTCFNIMFHTAPSFLSSNDSGSCIN